MIVYAYDEQQGLEKLEALLREIVGNDLLFSGFTDVRSIPNACKYKPYDVLFVNVEIQERSGMYLLSEMYGNYPYTNYIGTASKASERDALLLHRIYAGGYLIKPYDAEMLGDALRYLRYPVRERITAEPMNRRLTV